MPNVIDFGWWKVAGRAGMRLSWDVETKVLHLFDAKNNSTEALGACDLETARRLSTTFLNDGPEALRQKVAR